MAYIVGNSLCLIIILFFFLFTVEADFNTRFARHRRNKTPPPPLPPATRHANRSCSDPFVGTWVRDEDDATYPLYQPSDCPGIIDPEFDCQTYGRPDTAYLKYRWQPDSCQLPRFNGFEFLLRMRGKRVMFVGDSLGRNQWESLICMISASSPSVQTEIIRKDPVSVFRFLDYDLTVSFHRAPYLVDIVLKKGERVLTLDAISENAEEWSDADVLLFNTGHWWTHKGSLQGWDVMEKEGRHYRDMDRLGALESGLRTWSNWVDSNINSSKTRVFFQSVSPTHYNPTDWISREKAAATTVGGAKNCYGETAPFQGSNYPSASYMDQMRVMKEVIGRMTFPTYLLDISRLSALRKDGHPSIYNGDLSPSQRRSPERSADCSHWCLPGLPDTWNQLFYTALLY